MADSIITKQELIDAQKDVKNAGEAVNEKKIVNPRYGAPFKSLPLVIEELNIKADDVIAKGFYTGYATETALKSSLPDVPEMRARADDTRKIWRWNRTSAEGVTPVTGIWTDTGPSDVEKAVEEFLEEAHRQGVALGQLNDYYNYLMQRLAQIAVDKGWDASFVTYNGLTQQKINNGLISIEELLSVGSPKNGMRVFVKGLQGGWFEYNTSKASVNDGIMIFDGWVRITLETVIKPEWAGAVGDKVNDDTLPVQKCFDYVTDNTWKGSVYNTNRSGRAKLGVKLSRQYRITDTVWIGRGTKVFGDAVICGFNSTQDTIEGACFIADFNSPLQWAISSSNYTTTGIRPAFDQIFSGTDFNESRVSHAQGIELKGFNLITATGKRIYGGVRMTCAFDAVVEVGAIGFDYGILMNASWGAKVNSLTQHYKCGLFLRSDNNNVIFNGYYNAFSTGAPIPVADGATNLITNFTSNLGIDPAYALESASFGVVVHFGSGLSSSTCICERNTANFAVASTSVDIQTLYSESSKKTGVLNYASKLNVGDYTGYSDYSYFDIGQNGFVDVNSINKGATSQETMILHLDRYGTSLSVPKNMNGYIRGITFKGVDNILYINASAGNDLNNGLAPNTAIKTLNEAFTRITQTYNLNDKNTNIQPQLKPWTIILCANGDYPVTANHQINSDVTIKTLSASLNAANIIYNANSLYLNNSRFRVWGANVVSARTANATYYNAPFYNRSGDNVLELRGGTSHNLTNCSLIYCDETEVAAISLIIAGATVSGDATARFVQQNNVANSNHLVNVVVGKSTISADILGRVDKGVAIPALWQGKVLGL